MGSDSMLQHGAGCLHRKLLLRKCVSLYQRGGCCGWQLPRGCLTSWRQNSVNARQPSFCATTDLKECLHLAILLFCCQHRSIAVPSPCNRAARLLPLRGLHQLLQPWRSMVRLMLHKNHCCAATLAHPGSFCAHAAGEVFYSYQHDAYNAPDQNDGASARRQHIEDFKKFIQEFFRKDRDDTLVYR